MASPLGERKPIERDFSAVIQKIVLVVQDESTANRNKLECLNTLVNVCKNVNISTYFSLTTLLRSFRTLVCNGNKAVRAAVFRTIRYLGNERVLFEEMLRLHVHKLLPRSLDRDQRYGLERLQALKLVRKMMEVDAALVPRNVVQSLVSVAEHACDDTFRQLCLETLRELAVHNTRVVSECGGLRTLYAAVLEPALKDMTHSIIMTLALLHSDPARRVYVRADRDPELLLAPLTDIDAATSEHKEKVWAQARVALVTWMRTWSGLVCFAANAHALRSVVRVLELPSSEQVRMVVFDIMDDLLRIGRAQPAPSPSRNVDPVRSPPNLARMYAAHVVNALMHCGLVDALIRLGKTGGAAVAPRATALLGELMTAADELLPEHVCAELHALRSVMVPAVPCRPMVQHGGDMVRAAAVLNHLHDFAVQRHRHDADTVPGGNTAAASRAKTIRLRVAQQMSDSTLQALVRESQVPNNKDYGRWDWTVISELLHGPLTSTALFLDALHRTKLIKRLLNFYTPDRQAFCTVVVGTDLPFVSCGCQLVAMLATSDDGVAALLDSQLVQQLVGALRAEVAVGGDGTGKGGGARGSGAGLGGSASGDGHTGGDADAAAGVYRLFAPDEMRAMVTGDYITMLGVLSRTARGVEVLRECGVWGVLEAVVSGMRADLVTRILATFAMDGAVAERSRRLLDRAAQCSAAAVRVCAVRALGEQLWTCAPETAEWRVEVVLALVNDVAPEVRSNAIRVMEEACNDREYLRLVVAKAKSVDELPQDSSVLMRMLSLPRGFDMLSSRAGWLEELVREWRTSRNEQYVHIVENLLSTCGMPGKACDVPLPEHFCGELCRTAGGTAVLVESGILGECAAVVRSAVASSLQVRAALWVLGHVGMSPHAAAAMRETGVLADVAAMALRSPVLSLRGTACFVLCLVASHAEGRAMVEAHGWATNAAGAVLPVDAAAFFRLPASDEQAVSFPAQHIEPHVPKFDDARGKFLHTMSNLSNHVIHKQAYKELTAMKVTTPTLYTSPSMMFAVLGLFEHYHYRLPVRRFVHDLYDGCMFVADAYFGDADDTAPSQ